MGTVRGTVGGLCNARAFDELGGGWARSASAPRAGHAAPCSKTSHGATGNVEYTGKSPIFMTCKLSDLQWLEWCAQVNPSTGAPWDANASMVNRRLKVYRFCHRVEKPREQLKCCSRCFAELVTSQAAAWAAAHRG